MCKTLSSRPTQQQGEYNLLFGRRMPGGYLHMVRPTVHSDSCLCLQGCLEVILQASTSSRRLTTESTHQECNLLIELIEGQTAKNGIQVITTTHSPDMLNFISDATFENTSVVYRDENSADAIIRPVPELHNARELRKSQGLGRLHTGGWMETALAFTEGGYSETETEE